MRIDRDKAPRIVCKRCGAVRVVPLFPLYCSCGLRTNADGSTVSVRRVRGLWGDMVARWIDRALTLLGLRRVVAGECGGCERRQQKLNRAGIRVAWYVAAWRRWSGWSSRAGLTVIPPGPEPAGDPRRKAEEEREHGET